MASEVVYTPGLAVAWVVIRNGEQSIVMKLDAEKVSIQPWQEEIQLDETLYGYPMVGIHTSHDVSISGKALEMDDTPEDIRLALAILQGYQHTALIAADYVQENYIRSKQPKPSLVERRVIEAQAQEVMRNENWYSNAYCGFLEDTDDATS